jgi:hypothetical protein
MGAIGPVWTSATDASRETDSVLYCANATATPKEAARLKGVTTPSFIIASGLGTPGTTLFQNGGITHTGVNFIVGNSSGTTSIGTSTGPVVISNTSANTISIHNTVNATNSTAGIVFGNATSFTQTSGTRNYINNNWSFSPTSGTAVHNQLSFTGTINQTGGASGIVRGINLAHTMTAAADYRAIEIADNLATAKGIYQTGALTTNNFVGKTTHGSTTAPTALLMLAAGTTAATTAPLKFTSGPVMTTPEAGAVEFLTDAAYLTTTTGTVRRMLVGSQCARATAQTAANSSIATFTTPAVDGTYEVSGHITVTTSSAEAFSLTVDYTDESNTARTATIPLLRISTGAFTVTTISASGAVTYPSATIPIRCKASTAITLKTAGTFTGCTYNVEGCIKQIN